MANTECITPGSAPFAMIKMICSGLKFLNLEILTCDMFRSIRKVISLRNISKVFLTFLLYNTLMAYAILYMLLYSHVILFLKSYQRIIRQHLYINIKYIPMTSTATYFKYIPMKTQQHCTPTSYSQYFVASPFALIRHSWH